MIAFDWGEDETPHPTAAGYGTERLPVGPDELPEVRQLVTEGWWLSPDAPVWVFLPAVWPTGARTWVPDRATRYEEQWSSTGHTARVPWSDTLRAEVESDLYELLSEAGLPPRPPGRLWLLRPPATRSLDDVLGHVAAAAERRDVDRSCNPAFVEFVARELHAIFDSR